MYRHFPTHDALVDAMWLDAYPEFDWVLEARSPGDLAAAVALAFADYDKVAPLLKAAMRCARCDLLRRKTRPARVRKFARSGKRSTEGLRSRMRSGSGGLEDENRRLKRLLAEAMLDNAALKDLLGKNV